MILLQLTMSALTIWVMLSAGSMKRWSWAIALINQALWVLYIWLSKSWGLLPMNVVLTVVYVRNLWLWRQFVTYKIFPDRIAEGDTITAGDYRATWWKKPPFGVEYTTNQDGRVDGIVLGPSEQALWEGTKEYERPDFCPLPEKNQGYHPETLVIDPLDEELLHTAAKAIDALLSGEESEALDGYRQADYLEQRQLHLDRCSIVGCKFCKLISLLQKPKP